MFRRSKKGFAEDWLFIPMLIVGIVIMVFAYSFMTYHINDRIQQSDVIDQVAKDAVENISYKYVTYMDGIILFVYIMAIISVLISSYIVQSNIKFGIIGVIFLLVTVWVLPFIIDVALKFMTGFPEQQMVADLMPRTTFILENMVLLQAVFFVVAFVIFYGKSTIGGKDDAVF